jgi:hypothetical protein
MEGKVEFLFIGKPDEALMRHRGTMAHPRVIRLEPYMSHRGCVQAILSAHLCVVNTVGNRIPGKVYECMRAGKPILALTEPESDLSSMLRRYAESLLASAGDAQGIRHNLADVWQHHRTRIASSVNGIVSLYDAKRGAKSIADLLGDFRESPGRWPAPLMENPRPPFD